MQIGRTIRTRVCSLWISNRVGGCRGRNDRVSPACCGETDKALNRCFRPRWPTASSEKFPTSEPALFNRGFVSLSEQEFARAHECFERAFLRMAMPKTNSRFKRCGCSGGMGRHRHAFAQFAKADSISEEWVRSNIGLLESLLKHLSVSVSELMRDDPGNQRYADLWSKYFPGS